MTATLGSYSFLPWLRQGVGSSITADDGDPSVRLRATIAVDLTISGSVPGGSPLQQSIRRDVQLFGPGDVVGVDPKAIIRTEPRNWVTNFEPNYLAAIEFYEEDFPWRYTPAAPDGSRLRLRPWLTLVVLAEDEFTPAKNLVGRPLDYIEVADRALFPPADELWAWAHVHVNRSLAANDAELVSSDMGEVLPRLDAVLRENPDLAYARIVCPRRLAEKAHYHAFLVPVFESGRLAGLGLDPTKAPHATASAWGLYDAREEPTFYPVYHRWEFHTGAQGDFESLVRMLEPRRVDARVGTRDMDVLHPGSNLLPIDDAQLRGVLKLGGALRVPRRNLDADQLAEAERYERWAEPAPHAFQRALARFVNLADDYEASGAAPANQASGLGDAVRRNRDPLLTAPLYGRWHALASRLLTARGGADLPDRGNWVHELNLDPRFRAAAAFGTRVVQGSQEDYMRAAWQQIGDVIEANRRIRAAQLASETAWTWHARHLVPLAKTWPERALGITAPAQRHVVVRQETLHFRRSRSAVAPAMTSVAMRRITRPGARVMRRLPFDATRTPRNLLARVNAGEVSAAPPPKIPPAVPTVDRIADRLAPAGVPGWLLALLARAPWLNSALLLVALLLAAVAVLLLSGTARALVVLLAALLAALARLTARWARASAAAGVIREAQTPEAVDALPVHPSFVLSRPGTGPGSAATPGDADSPTAVRFKGALRGQLTLRVASAEVDAASRRPLEPLALGAVVDAAVGAVDPLVAVPRRVARAVQVPPRIAADLAGRLEAQLDEIMAYPQIDVPMYRPLKDISSELFLPNLDLVPPNSITLVETNRKFIEAYMVGVNHEFARELLWREYPTDQRGSYFRQFWDVRGVLPDPALSPEQQRERLRDIPQIHLWPKASNLGEHPGRPAQVPGSEDVVLVIRGELLKKYPTAVIYAQAAQWQHDEAGNIDPSQERELVEVTPPEEANPPRAKVRMPLYEAKVEPDIYFFGFDLTADEAVGGTGEAPQDQPGWFFVIRERPGEPRFGFDISREGPLQTMSDLAWNDAIPSGVPGSYVSASSLASLVLQPLGPGDTEKQPQRDEDLQVNAAQVSAARWAYVLYQAPVMVAVHAAEMLRR